MICYTQASNPDDEYIAKDLYERGFVFAAIRIRRMSWMLKHRDE